MRAAQTIRRQVRRNRYQLYVIQRDSEIFSLNAGLQNTVHPEGGSLERAPLTYRAIKDRGCLVELFDDNNRAVNPCTGELAPVGINGNGYAVRERL